VGGKEKGEDASLRPLESVYLFSRQEKSFIGERTDGIPLKSPLLMSQLVQNHQLSNYLLLIYGSICAFFSCSSHADPMFSFSGSGKS